MARQLALPPNLPPRLIGRQAAAAYVSISPTKFDELVESGLMPLPRRLGGRRRAWDVRDLDAAIAQLPVAGEDSDATWEDVDAA